MDNVRGSILMVLAMLGFAIEDMFIKLLSAHLPAGEVMMILGVGGVLLYWIALRRQNVPLFSTVFFERGVVLRNIAEFVGTGAFVTAFTLGEISTTSAIMQALPLVVTMGGALFLGQQVGWRRWTAIFVGFIGVIIVINPQPSGVDPLALLALVAVLGLGSRDVITRPLRGQIHSLQLAAYGFVTIIPLGATMMVLQGETPVVPTGIDYLYLLLCISIGVVAYYLLILASRIGELAVVAPFRYTRILFALTVGAVVFAETLELHMLVGCAIIVMSGIYTFYRESRARRASLSSSVRV
ncbi:DMT family transporter [Marivivens aquimaris]|uniref:DMT family transporter n=1 Tax=Marivivens aquimaris TaxID=2774876 RepID=UPI0018826B77|nr:DMT family transporter [Marivivens aquimaris]